MSHVEELVSNGAHVKHLFDIVDAVKDDPEVLQAVRLHMARIVATDPEQVNHFAIQGFLELILVLGFIEIALLFLLLFEPEAVRLNALRIVVLEVLA